MPASRYTIRDFEAQFPNDDACLDFLFHARWPQGVTCATCQRQTKHFRRTKQRAYSCTICGTLVFPTAGTVFHKSSTPLRLWFYACFLMANTRAGISAKQLERELGVTYKTAWRMFHQIRKLMDEDGGFLTGKVEADETFIGGKEGNKHEWKRLNQGRGAVGKTPVMGLAQRKGRIVARVTTDVKARTLLPVVWKNVPAHQGHTVYTDELASYNLLPKLGYTHERVQHGANVWVSGERPRETIIARSPHAHITSPSAPHASPSHGPPEHQFAR